MRELELLSVGYELARSETVGDVENAIRRLPMSFNFFYAGRDQMVKYWHIGSYPRRPAEPIRDCR